MSSKPSKQIVLCATQRCGSTFIVEDVQSTDVMGAPREYFIGWKKGADRQWAQNFDAIVKKATTANGVAAYKIMAKQLAGIDYGLSQFMLAQSGTLFPHFAEQFKDATFVYLSRNNVVAQGISREMARQTGINHATADKNTDHFAGKLMKGYSSSYNEESTYNFQALQKASNSVIYENLLWERFFSQNGIEPVRMVYETSAKLSKQEILQTIATAADIDLSLESIPKERKIVKLSNVKNAEWEDRFFTDLVTRRLS